MEPKRGRRSGRPAGAADKGVAAGGGDAVAARRKRSSKNPDVELIAALQEVRISTESKLKDLTAEHETLRAHNDALGGVTACLGQLIAATRPLRAAAAAAARRRAAAAAAAQGPGTHASDVARMSVAFEEAEEWPELRHLTALLTGAAAASPSTADPCEGSTGRAGRAQGGRGGGGAACDSADSLRNDGGGCGGGSSRGGGGGEGGRTGGGGRGGRRAGMQTRRRSTEQAGAALQTGRGAAAASRQHGGGGSGRGDGGAQQHSAGLSSTQGSAPEHATGAAHSGALPPALARGGSCSSDGSGSAGFGAPSWMEHMGLGGEGGAAAALERFEAMGVRAVAKRVRQYVQVCSVDLFQLRAGAGAATGPTAHARLQAQMDRLIAFSTALVASNPRVLGEVSVYRLDSCEPYGADGPARSHWAFVLRQARMTRRQELAMARLLELYHGRLAVFLPRREALLARQADSAADPAAQEEVLAELEHYTCEYTYCAMAFANALYTSILDADQAAAVWVSSYPYVPSLVVLGQALSEMMAERQAAQQAAGAPQPGEQRPPGPPPAPGGPR